MLRSGSPDALVASDDAPMTATELGSKSKRTRGSDTKLSSREFSVNKRADYLIRISCGARSVHSSLRRKLQSRLSESMQHPKPWIPASAGMTDSPIPSICGLNEMAKKEATFQH